MSWNPCSNCRRTDQGRLRYWYLAGFEGERSLRYRLRLCNGCMEALLMDLISVADVHDAVMGWVAAEAVGA